MNKEELLRRVDHTLLAQDARWDQIRGILDDALRFHTASACIPPLFVKQAAEYVNGNLPICTVIGFPEGYHTTAVKAFETEDALKNGAAEIDMVIPVGLAKEGSYDKILQEIRVLKDICGEHVLKVIVETCLLTEEEKIRLCDVVSRSGADYIKTSTGFAGGGATFADVALFRKYADSRLKIKAAGGISSFEDAEKFVELGADRLGTSRLVKLMK